MWIIKIDNKVSLLSKIRVSFNTLISFHFIKVLAFASKNMHQHSGSFAPTPTKGFALDPTGGTAPDPHIGSRSHAHRKVVAPPYKNPRSAPGTVRLWILSICSTVSVLCYYFCVGIYSDVWGVRYRSITARKNP